MILTLMSSTIVIIIITHLIFVISIIADYLVASSQHHPASESCSSVTIGTLTKELSTVVCTVGITCSPRSQCWKLHPGLTAVVGWTRKDRDSSPSGFWSVALNFGERREGVPLRFSMSNFKGPSCFGIQSVFSASCAHDRTQRK